MRAARWALVAVPLLGASAAARVEPAVPPATPAPAPIVELQVFREGATEGCLAEGELRGRLTADLGYDPFLQVPSGSGTEVLRIQFGDEDGLLTAALELIDPRGRTVALQTLRSSDPTCAGLGSAVEVAVSVMFDRREEPPKAKPSEDQLLVLSPMPVITLPPEPPPPVVPVHFLAGALVAFGKDLAPQPAVQLAVRWPAWSLEIEGRREFFQPYDISLSRYLTRSGAVYIPGVVVRRDLLTIAPCLWTGTDSGLAFCPVLMGGMREVAGGAGQPASYAVVSTGARLAVSAPLFGPVSLRLQGGVVFPLLGGTATVNGIQFDEPRSMALDMGAGLSVQVF